MLERENTTSLCFSARGVVQNADVSDTTFACTEIAVEEVSSKNTKLHSIIDSVGKACPEMLTSVPPSRGPDLG